MIDFIRDPAHERFYGDRNDRMPRFGEEEILDEATIGLIVDWLSGLDERFMGTEEFAHSLMLFADGSSMLGYAGDRLDVRFYPKGTFIIRTGQVMGRVAAHLLEPETNDSVVRWNAMDALLPRPPPIRCENLAAERSTATSRENHDRHR